MNLEPLFPAHEQKDAISIFTFHVHIEAERLSSLKQRKYFARCATRIKGMFRTIMLCTCLVLKFLIMLKSSMNTT